MARRVPLTPTGGFGRMRAVVLRILESRSWVLMKRLLLTLLPALLLMAVAALPAARPARAEEIRVAVASNFAEAMTVIAGRFEADTGHQVTLIFGSTGRIYAQIVNGAPFDVFLAADAHRPALLEQDGMARPGSRFTYAVGQLVLWSPDPGLVDAGGDVLAQGGFRHLAVANPGLAPYGAAAREVLRARGLWEELAGRIVRGENIGQTFQFVRSGNAELGFVARSQVVRPGRPREGSWWDVPPELHEPLEQQAVLLADKDTARDLLSFMGSDAALEIIRDYGYHTSSCSVKPISPPSRSP